MTYINTMNGKISDTETRTARLDASTNATTTVGYEHHEIHAGSHYFLCNYESLSNADVKDFTFITPDTAKEAHFIFAVHGQGLFL